MMQYLTLGVKAGVRPIRLLVLLVLLTISSACATRTEIIDLYENKAYIGQNYNRILVADISGTVNDREEFEKLLAAAIREEGSDAIASYTVIGFKGPVNAESISTAIERSGADAVLVTHMASIESEPTLKEGRVDVQQKCRQGDLVHSFLYDYPEIKSPDEVGVSHTAKVIANLYDARDSERIWAVQSTCFDRDNWAEVVVDQTNGIADYLQRRWLQN